MKAIRTFSAKAQAKVIIVGEHFVVSHSGADGESLPGAAAVALPLSTLQTEISLSLSDKVYCNLQDKAGPAIMEIALRLAANRLQWDLQQKPLNLYSRSNFPSSRGLGSSASFSVALARAFGDLAEKSVDIRTEAQQIENLFHGKSSGLDTSTIASESAILFQNGAILKNFTARAVDFVIADSGPRDSASALIARTMELRRERPELWKSLSSEITDLAKACVQQLENPNGAAEVARIIHNAQEILTQIGLMSEALAELLALGKKAGALAGKLSGAGSGGVALFVTNLGEGPELGRKMTEAGANVVTIA